MVTPAKVPRAIRKCVRYKGLLDETTELSGYLKYEVDDVLKNFFQILKTNLAQGYSIAIPEIGTIRRKNYDVSSIHKRYSNTDAVGLSIKASPAFKTFAKDNYNPPNNKDNPFLNGSMTDEEIAAMLAEEESEDD